MYSKYNAERGKRQYHSSKIAESGDYGANDMDIKNIVLVPTRSQINFDDENIIKMPKRFQQDFEVLSKPTYNYQNNDKLDDNFDFLPTISISPYRTHNHSYQHHDHYHHKPNEYHFQKEDYRCHPDQQPDNHQHHILRKYRVDAFDKFGYPLQSVHQSSVYTKHNFNNNNNYTNDYTKSGDRYAGGHQRQSLPTQESLNQKFTNLGTDQHYLHYYSYFYDHNNLIPKLANSSGRSRKLPIKTTMPFSKKSVPSNDIHLKGTKPFLVTDNGKDIENNPGSNYNYVLKEKSANNNGNWHYDTNDVHQFKVAGGDYLDLKKVDRYAYKNGKKFNEKESGSALQYLQEYKSKLKLRPNSLEGYGNLCYTKQLPVVQVNNEEEKVNTLNMYEHPKRQQVLQTKCDREETSHRKIKLPTTPVKSKAISVKKYSPPPKNRRVLLYNIQSPRPSRLLISHSQLQKSKLKHYNNSKKSVVNEKSCDGTTSRLKHLRTIICDISEKDDNKNVEDKNKSDSNSDDDDDADDDDFDTAFDFDSCSDSDISSDSEECYKTHAYKLTHSSDANSSAISLEFSIHTTKSIDNPDTLLVPSLFPNVPPYLAFSSNTKKGPEVPSDLYRILKWRVSTVMPRVVRSILSNSGMRLLKKTNEWMGVWGKHLKSPCFKAIKPYQKINHLPGSFRIGRKDSCWKNLVKQMAKHGKKDFGFMPKTYIIPGDLQQLRKCWPKYAQKNVKWIIKPPASARGTGIRVVDSWSQIPKRKPLIVQKYIDRPFLINGSKFDLRLYVLVTSINPLRVYMYHNGLARFASVKYSDKSDTLYDRCMHLTNYSINKFSSNYSKNEDVNACHGHKWTIKSLWSYLSGRGVRTDLLWAALKSLVLRTILAGENSINNMIRANVESKYSCFELFGFDVLLDADLVPWLLEVNISPSLHSELPLDSHVKAPLVQSVLNTALYNIPPKIPIERQIEIAREMSLPPGPICYDKRMYINYLSRTEKIKHNTFTRKSMEERNEYIDAILEHLTPDDVRCLVIAEDELARCAPLERIFPTVNTYKYLKYTEAPRYYNRLLDAWESRYANNRIEGIYILRQYCEDQYHLEVPQIPTKKYFEADDNISYTPCDKKNVSGFFGKISEMDIKIIITAVVFVTIISITLCVISYFVIKYTST